MKKSVFVKVLLFVALLVGAFLGGASYNRSGTGENHSTPGQRRILHYVDPMNPSHTSDKPGVAPCGMALEPVYADEESTAGDAQTSARPLSPGTVKISAQKQQLIGVQVEAAEMASETHTVRTLGRVAPGENRVYKILSGADGAILSVAGGTTGSVVQKDQLLATIYNPLFLARAQQYLNNLAIEETRQRQLAQLQAASAQQPGAQPASETPQTETQGISVLLQNTAQTPAASPGMGSSYFQGNAFELAKALFDLGVGDYQLKELGRTKQATPEIEIRSPVAGIVLARSISPQQRFDKSTEFFRIADISRVWVLADVYEREAQYIRPGTSAKVSIPRQGKVLEAKVSDVTPQFDPATRTFKVRLELDNPDFVLLPDMFVDVDFLITLPDALTVAADAVLDSGLRKTVFAALGNGFFEPRIVETGWRYGDRVQILSGLMPGDEIVVSGNFLIDSESRMKLAAAGLHGTPEKDPMCGTNVYPAKARKEGLTSDLEGQTYYFCSPQCKAEFDKQHDAHMDMPSTNPSQHGAHMDMPSMNPEQHGAHMDMPATNLERHDASVDKKASVPGTVTRDPVCGMAIPQNRAKAAGLTMDYEGTIHYFCSRHCKEKFEKDPQYYLEKMSVDSAHHDAPNHGEHKHD